MSLDALDLLLKNYNDLLERVDTHVKMVTERYRDHIACKKGCDACCRFLNLFPVEAFALSRAFLALPETDQARILEQIEREEDKCPLLINRACLLYKARPVICRTHGFPLYLQKEEGPMVDFCPENFKGMTELPKEAMMNLDKLNTLLTAVNQHFMANVEADLPDRIPVSQALFLCRGLTEED
ncbi:MAG: YkgJ family cysteine cluster protein [Desulfobacterales bacterium]|nr:YkgJ family cysteine cluster protein [Desulfobacterales bacterium]